MAKTKRKRARTKDGRFIKDNPDTPHNEAYGEKPNNTKKLIGVLHLHHLPLGRGIK